MRGFQDTRLYLLPFCIIALYALFSSFYAHLDDAFIHLRYAEHLLEAGRYSFNGQDPDFGISSPLYPALLSIAVTLGLGPLAPKICSLTLYALLIGFVGWRLHLAQKPAKPIHLTLLLSLLTPSAIRWLSDGMETSLVVFFAIVMAYLLVESLRGRNRPAIMALAVVTPFALLTRIEFLGIIAFSLAVIAISPKGVSQKAYAMLALACAAIMGLGIYLWIFGTILPDTAVAKSNPAPLSIANLADFLYTLLQVHAATPVFSVLLAAGVLLALLRIITSTQGRQRRWAIALIILACGVPLTLYAIAFVRAQTIQGVRHFLLAEVFAVAFLAFLSNRLSLENPEQHASDRMFDLRRMASALWLVAALGSVAELFVFERVWQTRSESFHRFIALDPSAFSEKPCLAFDIGLFSYFTDCELYDMNGLVNGREVAQLSFEERSKRVPWEQLSSVFVNEGQLASLQARTPFDRSQWREAAVFDLANLSGDDRHYLLVRKEY